MSEIEVKALEWKAFYPDEPGGVITADDGAYIVNKEHMLGYWFCRRLAKRIGNTFPTAEAAQAAAQSDYEARIRSALVEPRVTDTSITKLYMEAAKAYRGYDHDFNGDGLMAAVKTVAAALSASPSPVDSRDGLGAATVKALENARTQILSAYRVWVADDIAAFPPPKTQAGEVIAQIDTLLAAKEQQP